MSAGPLVVAVLGRGIVDPAEPVIHADDLGLLRGLAVFETIRFYGGRPFALDAHLDRLQRSADRLGLAVPERAAIVELATDAIAAAGIADGSVRYTLTGGREATAEPVLMVTIAALPPDLEAIRARRHHGHLAPARHRPADAHQFAVAARGREVHLVRGQHGRVGRGAAPRGRRRRSSSPPTARSWRAR